MDEFIKVQNFDDQTTTRKTFSWK